MVDAQQCKRLGAQTAYYGAGILAYYHFYEFWAVCTTKLNRYYNVVYSPVPNISYIL